jgi:hypothetical protein
VAPIVPAATAARFQLILRMCVSLRSGPLGGRSEARFQVLAVASGKTLRFRAGLRFGGRAHSGVTS